MSYCDIAPDHPIHAPYHDAEYGFPVTDDARLNERLALEVFQAGLSWLIVLKKRPAFYKAFRGFAPEKVARFSTRDKARLMGDEGIIRNARKIDAVIENSRRIRALAKTHGSFSGWLSAQHPRPKDDWVKLFREHFLFMGGEVVGEFLMSTGYLPGAHAPSCPVYQQILALDPPWRRDTTTRRKTAKSR